MKKNFLVLLLALIASQSTANAFDTQFFVNQAKDMAGNAMSGSMPVKPQLPTASPYNYNNNNYNYNKMIPRLAPCKIEVFDPDTKQLVTVFRPGMSVYINIFTPAQKTFAQTFNTTDVSEDMQNVRLEAALYDGSEKLGSDTYRITEISNLKSTSFRIWIDPNDKTKEVWNETQNFRTRVFATNPTNYYKLQPKVYNLKLDIYYDHGEISDIAHINIPWDLSGQNFAKWQQLAKLINQQGDSTVKPSKPAQSNPKLEAEIKALMSSKGVVKRVIITDPDWGIERNEYGIITHRIIYAEVIYQKPDGGYQLSEMAFRQDYFGSNSWGKTKINGVGLKQSGIAEQNIWK